MATDLSTTIAQGQDVLGIALGSLGFGDVRLREDNGFSGYGDAYVADLGDAIRVITYVEDGFRTVVIGWATGQIAGARAGRTYGREVEAWRMEFAGSTPVMVAVGAIAIAAGKLDVTR